MSRPCAAQPPRHVHAEPLCRGLCERNGCGSTLHVCRRAAGERLVGLLVVLGCAAYTHYHCILQPIGTAWQFVDGAVQATGQPGCITSGLVMVATSAAVASYTGVFNISTTVQTSFAAGLVFYASPDGGSYYALTLNTTAKVVAIQVGCRLRAATVGVPQRALGTLPLPRSSGTPSRSRRSRPPPSACPLATRCRSTPCSCSSYPATSWRATSTARSSSRCRT